MADVITDEVGVGEDRLDELAIERALDDLDDDVARTGAVCSEHDLNRAGERHDLSVVELAELRERAVARRLIAEPRSWSGVLESGALEETEVDGSTAADTLDALFRALRRYPLLTAAEEIVLGRAIEKGARAQALLVEQSDHPKARALGEDIEKGRAARQKMVACNIRLVINIAKSYRRQGLDFPDLIQAAIPGLIRAAEKFDHRRGFKFSTYATWWIHQAIARELANTGRMIRLPVHIVEKLNKFRRAHARLSGQFGREPSADELAAVLEWDPSEVIGLIESIPVVISLDTPIAGDGGTATVADLIPSNEPPVFDQVAEIEKGELLRDLLDNLSYRERRVLELRFGLGEDQRPRTLDEVGQMFNVTRERIRQIEGQALEKLEQLGADGRFY